MTPDRNRLPVWDQPLAAPAKINLFLHVVGRRSDGYHLLQSVFQLPIDAIKIDRSFVTGVVTDPGSVAIVKSIIGLAADLGMDCIAEGIETPEQLAALRRLGCPEIQGYLIGKPMAAELIDAFLEAVGKKRAA